MEINRCGGPNRLCKMKCSPTKMSTVVIRVIILYYLALIFCPDPSSLNHTPPQIQIWVNKKTCSTLCISDLSGDTKETFICSYFSVLRSPALWYLPNFCPNVIRPRLCSWIMTCYIKFTGKENIYCVLTLCAFLVIKKTLKIQSYIFI